MKFFKHENINPVELKYPKLNDKNFTTSLQAPNHKFIWFCKRLKFFFKNFSTNSYKFTLQFIFFFHNDFLDFRDLQNKMCVCGIFFIFYITRNEHKLTKNWENANVMR